VRESCGRTARERRTAAARSASAGPGTDGRALATLDIIARAIDALTRLGP